MNRWRDVYLSNGTSLVCFCLGLRWARLKIGISVFSSSHSWPTLCSFDVLIGFLFGLGIVILSMVVVS